MRRIKLPPITRSRLVEDLKKLGVSSGDVVMLHVSVKSVGWIVGGPDMIIQALLDVLGTQGTLMMYVGWEDSPIILQTGLKMFSVHTWKNALLLTQQGLVHTENGAY